MSLVSTSYVDCIPVRSAAIQHYACGLYLRSLLSPDFLLSHFHCWNPGIKGHASLLRSNSACSVDAVVALCFDCSRIRFGRSSGSVSLVSTSYVDCIPVRSAAIQHYACGLYPRSLLSPDSLLSHFHCWNPGINGHASLLRSNSACSVDAVVALCLLGTSPFWGRAPAIGAPFCLHKSLFGTCSAIAAPFHLHKSLLGTCSATTAPFCLYKSLLGTCFATGAPFRLYKSLLGTCSAIGAPFCLHKSLLGTCSATGAPFCLHKSLLGTCSRHWCSFLSVQVPFGDLLQPRKCNRSLGRLYLLPLKPSQRTSYFQPTSLKNVAGVTRAHPHFS